MSSSARWAVSGYAERITTLAASGPIASSAITSPYDAPRPISTPATSSPTLPPSRLAVVTSPEAVPRPRVANISPRYTPVAGYATPRATPPARAVAHMAAPDVR